MSVRRYGTALVAVTLAGVAAVLLGPVPRGAAADPSTVAPRYSTRGWVGVAQAGATVLACPDAAPTCPAPGLADVDSDASTVDSSRATVTIPARSQVSWAGLTWAGDTGTGTPARCAGAPDGATAATPPAAVDRAGTVGLGIAGRPYLRVTAVDARPLVGPSGTAGYQAYADITTLLRPYGGKATATDVPLTVAGVQTASGPGCVAGWVVTLVYDHPDGPDPTNAPQYRALAVYTAQLSTVGGAGRTTLTGVGGPADAPATGAVTTAVLTSGPGLALTLGTTTLAATPTGPGYRTALAPLPSDGVSSTADLWVSGPPAYAATVAVIAVDLPLRPKLTVGAAYSPATVAVGSVVELVLTVTNDSDTPNADVSVAAPLPAGLSVAEPQTAYDATSGVWSVGTLAAHASATLTLDVRVGRAGSFPTAARISAAALTPSPSAADVLADLTAEPVATSEPTPDPTIGQAIGPAPLGFPRLAPGMLFGVGIFALGLLLLLIVVLRRRTS